MIAIREYPQLRLLAWNRQDDDALSDAEALALYESNWRFVDQASLSEREQALLERLVREVGKGVLNV